MTLEQAIECLRKHRRVYINGIDTPYHIVGLRLNRENLRDNSGIIRNTQIAAKADLRNEFGGPSRVNPIEQLTDNRAELIKKQIAEAEVHLKLLKEQLQKEEDKK